MVLAGVAPITHIPALIQAENRAYAYTKILGATHERCAHIRVSIRRSDKWAASCSSHLCEFISPAILHE